MINIYYSVFFSLRSNLSFSVFESCVIDSASRYMFFVHFQHYAFKVLFIPLHVGIFSLLFAIPLCMYDDLFIMLLVEILFSI